MPPRRIWPLALVLAASVHAASVHAQPPGDLTLHFAEYTASFTYRDYFGISSLKLKGQQADFVHSPTRPIGDWEWFWLNVLDEQTRPPGPQNVVKLIAPDPPWGPPAVWQEDEHLVLAFTRPDAIRPGVTLEARYRMRTDRPEFEAHYIVQNASGTLLPIPYLMVGLPGFVNHAAVSSVETGRGDRRQPLSPHRNFLAEALADGREEYLLLRHDVAPRADNEPLEGRVTLREDGRAFTLSARHVPNPGTTRHAYSAHTNKPIYLTSHLYLFFDDLADTQEQRTVVRYELSSTP